MTNFLAKLIDMLLLCLEKNECPFFEFPIIEYCPQYTTLNVECSCFVKIYADPYLLGENL